MKQLSFIFMVLLSMTQNVTAWRIAFAQDTYEITMYDQTVVHFNVTGDGAIDEQQTIDVSFRIGNGEVATFSGTNRSLRMHIRLEQGRAEGNFTVEAVFLGRTAINYSSNTDKPLEIIVVRKLRVIDQVFTGSVAVLVSLIYINFGCALNWSAMRGIVLRPVGPLIGLLGQFLVMPSLAYLVGLLVFADRPEMRLGLLFTGVSPAGGASNVWTCLLEGNIDLSVTMTTVSTFAAFGLMNLWLFTLGPHIFQAAHIAVPYQHIATLAVALVVPLAIGWLIKRFLPKLATLLIRILKSFSAFLILFIIAFAIATNLYLFKLATWQIALSGLLLPWAGFLFGGALGALAKRPRADVVAIAIETGVQNTGIAIFLLRFSLPQPQADLTTVVPVAVAVMTPLPLAVWYLWRRFSPRRKDATDELTM